MKNLNKQRENLVAVFNDTLDFIKNNEKLSDGVQDSIAYTKIYTEWKSDSEPSTRSHVYFNNIFITKNKTFEAAMNLRKEYSTEKIAVLNFASATTPGGGVTKGSSAQEESLCRCSTLYPCLNSKSCWDTFYNPHRTESNPLHNDDIIYTPHVTICKSDDGNYTRLSENQFVTVDVITCAAPNLREKPNNQYNSYYGNVDSASITDEELYKIHLVRARCILNVAAMEGAEVLVLGAFGCGAFKNNPHVVARAYKEALKDYANKFKEIEFAIYCRGYETENYDAFVKEFK